MLTTLEQGVKGGKWFSLIDKVWSLANLESAAANVLRNDGGPGVDHITCAAFGDRLDAELSHVSRALREGTYVPQAIRRSWIAKPGRTEKRPLGIPTVRDRVTQTALRHVLEPIFERDFAEHSYGFRPGRGSKDALRHVTQLLKDGYTWVVDADLRKYFDTIPHDRLMTRVAHRVTDGRVLTLLRQYLQQQVLEDLRYWVPSEGTPQGAVISPLLANIYLDPLDHLVADHGLNMIRYADDFVILCRTEAEAQRALALVQQWVTENGLTLHPEKTHLVDASGKGGFDFLGYHFERGSKHWPSRKAIRGLKDNLRELTPRNSGRSLEAMVRKINPVLRGWLEYFKHGNTYDTARLDGWLRMRLRSILRRRSKRHGMGYGLSHRMWPIAFFGNHGLFSLAATHASFRRSAQR